MLNATQPMTLPPCDFLVFLHESRGLERRVLLDLLGEWLVARHPELREPGRGCTPLPELDARSAP
jgi:hypothetical protein